MEIEPPGSHQIVLRDQGLDDGLDSDVSQVSRRSDRLDARQYDVIDIGLTPFISISDWAWVDADRDGIQDADEKGLPDVFVLRYRLLKQANEFVFEDATFTDGDGFYEFDRLRPGRYHLRFLPPDGYDYTLWDVGDIPTVDSDALRDTGVTPDIVLPDDAVRSSTFSDLITNRWDAGFVPGPRDVTQVSLDVADNPVVCDTGKPVKDPEVTISKVRAGRLSNGDRWFLVKMVKGLETDYSFAVVLNIRTPFGVITFIFETHDKRFRIGQVDSKTGELIAEAGEDLQIFNDQDLGVVGFLIPADVIADEADLAAIRSFHTPRKGEAKRCHETPSFNVAGP